MKLPKVQKSQISLNDIAIKNIAGFMKNPLEGMEKNLSEIILLIRKIDELEDILANDFYKYAELVEEEICLDKAVNESDKKFKTMVEIHDQFRFIKDMLRGSYESFSHSEIIQSQTFSDLEYLWEYRNKRTHGDKCICRH